MRLLGAVLQKFFHLLVGAFVYTVNMTKRRYRECAVFIAGGVVLAAVVMCASGFAGGGKNKVYAVQSSASDRPLDEEDALDGELQAGLMGIVDSVGCMERYSRTVSTVNLENAYEDILVGASRLERGELHRQKMSGGLKDISNVGDYALMEIRNHQMSYEDYDTLLHIVEAEATGGDLRSKILIANVVMNRVQDSRFPSTITDVVYQYAGGACQFSPVGDGRIHSVEITADTIEAVDRAISGEDYSGGALFFMARSSSDNSSVGWFDSKLKPLFSYGGHEFFTFAS